MNGMATLIGQGIGQCNSVWLSSLAGPILEGNNPGSPAFPSNTWSGGNITDSSDNGIFRAFRSPSMVFAVVDSNRAYLGVFSALRREING